MSKKDEKTMLRYLTGAAITLERIRELEDRIASKTYKVTPAYESTGGGSSGNQQLSKVERYVDDVMELKEELEKCKSRMELIDCVRNSKVLTSREYELVEWLMLGGKMSDFAREKNIYKSHVYKIRDNALKKIMKFVQNTPKCNVLWVNC